MKPTATDHVSARGSPAPLRASHAFAGRHLTIEAVLTDWDDVGRIRMKIQRRQVVVTGGASGLGLPPPSVGWTLGRSSTPPRRRRLAGSAIARVLRRRRSVPAAAATLELRGSARPGGSSSTAPAPAKVIRVLKCDGVFPLATRKIVYQPSRTFTLRLAPSGSPRPNRRGKSAASSLTPPAAASDGRRPGRLLGALRAARWHDPADRSRSGQQLIQWSLIAPGLFDTLLLAFIAGGGQGLTGPGAASLAAGQPGSAWGAGLPPSKPDA